MSPSTWWPVPYGPLQPFREYILSHSVPITWQNLPYAALLPIIPIGLQAYLLQSGGTRVWRIALAVLGLSFLWNAVTGYRFVRPDLNAYNNGLGVAFFHLALKYIEFALLPGRYIDPYASRGRSKVISAIDLCINSRMIGLEVDLDSPVGSVKPVEVISPGRDNGKDKDNGQVIAGDGSLKVDGDTRPLKIQSFLPRPETTNRTRLQALIRHAALCLRWLWTVDLCITIYKIARSGPSHASSPHATFNSDGSGLAHTLASLFSDNAVSRFANEHTILVLPHTPWSFVVSRYVVEPCIVMFVGLSVFGGLTAGYHAFACLALILGWEVESWEIDLMDKPWTGTSLLDIWGRRWHQLFRHQFLLLTTLTLRLLRQPPSSPLFSPLIFFFSASYHVLGQITADPLPPVLPIATFFLLSGIGAGLEVAFKRLTGRKISGWPGRVWAYAFLLTTGQLVAGGWLDAGYAECMLGLPGPGRWVAPWLTEWVFKVV